MAINAIEYSFPPFIPSGIEITTHTMKKESRDDLGQIIVQEGCDNVFDLAKKLSILSDIVADADSMRIKKLLSGAAGKCSTMSSLASVSSVMPG